MAFARFEDPEIFSRIGKAEVMLGCVGAFFLTASLRRHANGVSREGERSLLFLRMAIVAVAWVGVLSGGWAALYALALTAFAVTPAHLPLLMGYSPVLYLLLSGRLLVAAGAYFLSGYQAGPSMLAAIYFAPQIIYGLGCYASYWPKLPPAAFKAPNIAMGVKQMGGWGLHFATIGLCNIAQANMVFQLIRANWEWAVLERLLRSAYSFVFPYTVRLRIWTKKTTILCASVILALVALLAFHITGGSLVWLFIGPVMLDVYVSAVSGKFMLVDMVLILLLLFSGLIRAW